MLVSEKGLMAAFEAPFYGHARASHILKKRLR